MVYKYRVTLAGIKGFFRVYAVNADNSLYTFHKQLRSDLEFPQDQQIFFKALDAAGQVVARYALIDLGYGAVDAVKISDTLKAGVASFVYYYDIQAKKSVIITFEGECDEQTLLPRLLESKGPVPLEFENGYVAYEDLPESKKVPPQGKNLLAALLGGDDSEDEDLDDIGDSEEEEDDEDGKEIYDEDEGGF